MYAVIESGGKQYKVTEGQVLKLEKLPLDVEESVSFDKVLMIADGDKVELGAPYVSGKAVTAIVVAQGRHKKIKVLKFRRRKHHMKQMGHRQYFTQVKITAIQ
ncbi:MAG: ribosomal protein L21p [Gammaproteobacteria bacterium]|jgi:large subunit ribosomal protein L21|nr:ribosomal protein L21p [Gammaproteobacteria bacterium]